MTADNQPGGEAQRLPRPVFFCYFALISWIHLPVQ
jgi:hypothetical protein